jgi:hypothetical protein
VGFDDGLLHLAGPDVVGAGPPGIDAFGENFEGAVGTGLYSNASMNWL